MKIWLPMIIYIAIQAITPGPNNLTCLYLGGSYGFHGVKKFLTASMLSLLIKVLLCGLLNVALSELIPSVVKWLKWAGAAYMLYLAVTIICSGWKEESGNSAVRTAASYKDGVILQLLNGKSWVAALSVFAVYVMPISTKVRTVLWVSLLFTAFMLCASLIWAVFGSALKSIISKHRKLFGIIMGASLIWCAVSVVM